MHSIRLETYRPTRGTGTRYAQRCAKRQRGCDHSIHGCYGMAAVPWPGFGARSITVFGHNPPVVAFTAPSSATFAAPANVTFAVDAKRKKRNLLGQLTKNLLVYASQVVVTAVVGYALWYLFYGEPKVPFLVWVLICIGAGLLVTCPGS